MIKPAAILGSGMILQRNSKVAVFGETDCQSIEVEFDGCRYAAAISDGNFQAIIETKESGPVFTMLIRGIDDKTEEVVEFNDILLGDVWLAGGQSNMELELRNSKNGEEVASKADYEQIRFYNVPKIPYIGEELLQAEASTSWKAVRGEDCRYMSAVAFYFATKLYKETGVPIGIIDCYWGGTSATCWVDREALKDVPEVQGYIAEWDEVCSNKSEEEYEAELKEYNGRVDEWVACEARVKQENPKAEFKDVAAVAGDYPWPPPRGGKAPFRPFGLHKTMMKRVAPYGIKGFIYYQAEEDAERADYYSKLNSAVINQWRRDFSIEENTEERPFYLTQLPMFISAGCEDDKVWCTLRQQQKQCSMDNPNTYMAVISDCGEFDNIHPVDKETPGTRLALQVLANTYGLGVGTQNMEAVEFRTEGNSCVVAFTGTYGAVCVRPTDGISLTALVKEQREPENCEDCTDEVYGFEVSSDGKNYYRPHIIISDDTMILTGHAGEILTDIRYGWFNYGVANVYSRAGIPLMPFWKKLD